MLADVRERLAMSGSQSSLREANRALIVETVHRHGGLTQVELAGATGLSAATVSTIVKELLGAGVVYSSRSNGAQPGAGQMFELDAIAACFIGGASTTGGVGRVTGAMVGGLIMAVLSNGMQLMGIDDSVQQMVKGLVLLLAVAFDIFNKRRAGAAR